MARIVRAFAHRGGALHPDLIGRENTLAAFRHATELGYRDIETDVHLTADGVLVAFHDDVLDRVTDGHGSIASLPYSDVRRASIGGTEAIPSFEEVVQTLPPGTRFNVDLKAPGTADALAAFAVDHALEDRLTVGSFSRRELHRFRKATHGRVATSASATEVAGYVLSPAACPLRVFRHPVALQIPHHHRGRVVASEGLVRRAHSNGLEVHVWTIDDPAEMEQLIDRGVDGLMTDRTDILKAVLTARGLWEGP